MASTKRCTQSKAIKELEMAIASAQMGGSHDGQSHSKVEGIKHGDLNKHAKGKARTNFGTNGDFGPKIHGRKAMILGRKKHQVQASWRSSMSRVDCALVKYSWPSARIQLHGHRRCQWTQHSCGP